MLKNQYLVAKIGVDAAENGPRKERCVVAPSDALDKVKTNWEAAREKGAADRREQVRCLRVTGIPPL